MPWQWRSNGNHGATAEPPTGPAALTMPRDIESRTQILGRHLLTAAASHSQAVLSRKFWSDALLTWAMKDPHFKTELFRFIDVFPVLKTPDAILAHLHDYLVQPHVTLPTGLGVALKAGELARGTLARSVSKQIENMAGNFIAGADIASASTVLRTLWDRHIAFSVDLLGEACVSDREAAIYRHRYGELLGALTELVIDWPHSEQLEEDHLGPIPRANISLKISAIDASIRVADTDATVERMFHHLHPLLERARDLNVFINFDMEQHDLKDLTIRLFKRCCEAIDFPAGIALQAYLTSGEADAESLIQWARRTGRIITVRLIKGAYWDYETIHAQLNNWPSPVWRHKRETDACFERMTRLLIDAMPQHATTGGIKLAVGSHNARSIAHAMACLEAHGLPKNALEFQMLHGMAEELKPAIIAEGYRLRQYVPIGQMIPGMAYLVRRLLENTSNESWLRAGFIDRADPDHLLAAPDAHGDVLAAEPASIRSETETAPFTNEPPRDFSAPRTREEFSRAIASATLPSLPVTASEAMLDLALTQALTAFCTWRDRPPQERSHLILRAAERLRTRRDELSGIIIRESGKTWSEADADVCEAIDFCEFYARESLALATPQRLNHFGGELNEQWHDPRGVAAIISPWNFPLSIATGMTVAALVTGNTAILKPAEQATTIASVLCEILWESGIPREVLHSLPGPGETIGAALVRDPRVALIAFTGSKAVGLDIVQAAANTTVTQPFVKHVVCEMGGKNAIIIDASADMDEAVLGVRQSAFGYAGQKCSACSRVIVLEGVHDLFLSRLIESTRSLRIGDPLDPATDIGPVIDATADDKIRRYIDLGRTEATLAYASAATGTIHGKPLIGPHIFTNVPPTAAIANEEIFGPVLAVIRAATFEQALGIATSSTYRLTGGVYSRTPSHLARARREFRVGNLYLNRPITGALVGRQPFGGFGLSGLGSKAGGCEYLLQFTLPRVCTENTLRRGFAPGE